MHLATELLFDTDGQPTKTLRELLSLLDVSHNNTLPGVHWATQNAWYTTGSGATKIFRAEIKEAHGAKKDAAMPLLTALGFTQPITVQTPPANVTYMLLPGAKVMAVRKRLEHGLKEMERTGLTCDMMVPIASTRDLFPDELADPDLVGWATNEGDMTQRVVTLRIPNPPKTIKTLRATCVLRNPKGTTEETMANWRDIDNPPAGSSILVLSGQPFTLDQGLAAQLQFPGCKAYAIGYQAPDLPLTTYLDTIAKVVDKLVRLAAVS